MKIAKIFTLHCRAKSICFVILLLALTGCRESETHTYNPRDGIVFIVTLKEIKLQPEHKSVFLYFDLTIKNESSQRIYFNPGKVKANLNGSVSEFVYYDSLASVEVEKKELTKGVSNYHLYFVFKDTVDQKISKFVTTDFGLSE